MMPENTYQHLSPKQRQAIPLLAYGLTGIETSKQLGNNPSTLSKWMNHDKYFILALEDYSAKREHLALVQLESLTVSAVSELRQLMINAKSEQIRFKAIELILTTVGVGTHAKDVLTRYHKVEVLETDSSQYDFNKLIEAVKGE